MGLYEEGEEEEVYLRRGTPAEGSSLYLSELLFFQDPKENTALETSRYSPILCR
jgi:hypothetical protein